jgi:hypothetical protein
MQGHVDARRLVVKDYDHPMYPDSLRTVAVFDLPSGTVDLDEIPQKVYDVLGEAEITGYEVEDSRSTYMIGAGSSTQFVLLALASGAVEGAASALIDKLAAWCASKNRNRGRDVAQVDQSVERAKQLIAKHFNPQGLLEALEIAISDEQERFVLQDGLGNQFAVETRGSPHSIVARKVPDSNQSNAA